MSYYWIGFLLSIFLLSCQGKKSLPVLGIKDLSPAGDTVFHTIPDFSFRDQDSSLITQETVKGKIYVSDFFYTYCPTICPKMSEQMLRVHDAFLKEDRLVLLSHSIDPEHDTVAVLREYAQALNVNSDRWHMLTGDQEEIFDLAMEYMVSAAEDPDAPGGYAHSGAFILLDEQRRVRGYYDGTQADEVDELMADIRLLLGGKRREMKRNPTIRKLFLYGWPFLIFGLLFVWQLLNRESTSAGAKLYQRHCANCHMEEGKGLGTLIPALARSEYINLHGADMACLIRNGLQPSVESGIRQPMPGNEQLRPVEIAALISFLKTNWGNEGPEITLQQVEEALLRCRE